MLGKKTRKSNHKMKKVSRQSLPKSRYISTNYSKMLLEHIHPIIWMSLNVYPEISSVFDNLNVRYVKKTSKWISKTVQVLEYTQTLHSDIPNEMTEYNTYGVLKYTRYNKYLSSDNLLYEYLVGVCCTNTLSTQFPIFITTHNIYYVNPRMSKQLSTKHDMSKDEIIQQLIPIDIPTSADSCKYQYTLGIVLQYCHDLINLSDIQSTAHYKIELGLILFQIYYALSQTKHIFTHYDLHDDNAGVIPLHKNTCITYEYETAHKDGTPITIRFRSKYIVKIFDYGKSYFSGRAPTGKKLTSTMIYDSVNKTTECHPLSDYGFSIMPDVYIDARIPNQSHDLRLLYMLKPVCRQIPALEIFTKYLQYDGYFGTSIKQSTQSIYISTVEDASFMLASILTAISPESGQSIADNTFDIYSEYASLGTLKVFGLNRNMQFIPNPDYTV